MKYARMGFSTSVFMSGGISSKLFSEMLSKLPPDAKILGFGNADYRYTSHLFIGSDSFKEVPDVQMPPDIYVTFRRDKDPQTGMIKEYVEGIDFRDALATPATCIHVWKSYDSGFSKYDYCTICGVKQ